MKTKRSEDRPVMRALFGPQARQMGADWPKHHVLHQARLADLPELFRTGELSNVEALSGVYGGRLGLTGARAKERSQRRSQFPAQGSALDFYMNGMTVYFENVGACVPSVRPWLAQLEEEIGLPGGLLRLTAFATPGEKKGLPFHYDNTDNVIVQLRGKKRISIADNPTVAYPVTYYSPGFGLVREDLLLRGGREPPSRQVNPKVLDLEPGMVLFIPAGMWHATEHRVESYSLSLVIEWPRTADLMLARLRMELFQYPEWRRPLYGAWSSDEHTRSQAEKRLAITLAGLENQSSGIRPADALVEAASPAAAARHFQPDTLFYRAPFTKFVLRSSGKGISELRVQSTVSYARSLIEIPARYVPACRWIARQKNRFSVGELTAQPGVDLDVARELLSTLVEAGPVVRVPFRPRSKPTRATAARKEAAARVVAQGARRNAG